jgi:hypothetical protein
MADVNRIGIAEIRGSVKKDISYPCNDRCLLPLANTHDFKQPFIAFAEVEDISKDVVNEIIQIIW